MNKHDENARSSMPASLDGGPGFEESVREALLQISAPDSVKSVTLEAIESKRLLDEGGVSADASDQHAADATSIQAATMDSLPSSRRKHRWSASLLAAACLLLVAVLCGVGYDMYKQPAAYVGIDVNPSIELAVNRFDRVVEAKAINEDGQDALGGIELDEKGYQDALRSLVESSAMSEYMTPDSFVDVSVFSSDPALARSLQEQSDDVLAHLPCQGASYEVDLETRQSAQSAGMGMGKYRSASELVELDGSLELDDCRNMTMRQIRDRIDEICGNRDIQDREHAGHQASNGSESGNGNVSGSGNGSDGGSGNSSSGDGSGSGSGNSGATGVGSGTGSASGSGSGSSAGNGNGGGSGSASGSGSGNGAHHGQPSDSSGSHGNHHGSDR